MDGWGQVVEDVQFVHDEDRNQDNRLLAVLQAHDLDLAERLLIDIKAVIMNLRCFPGS